MRSTLRWMLAVGLLGTSCSLITDFDPGKAGAGGMSGGGGGASGAGGMAIDAASDGRRPDAAIDAHPDAPTVCMSSSQCDDGFACTRDTCVFPGMCQNTPVNQFCAMPTNLCTIDSCMPTSPIHEADGCVHLYISCNQGEICVTDQGCITVPCQSDLDCPAPADCCRLARCESHQCTEVPRCDGGQVCRTFGPTACTCQ